MKYNLDKIIILGKYLKDDQYNIETVAMHTKGLKICHLLYANSLGIIGESKKDLKEEIKSELYEDQYDDDLKIKIKEAINGEDCIYKLRDWILKHADENTLIYFYNPSDECFELLETELKNSDSSIYIDKYSNAIGMETDNKSIQELMKEYGLKIENLIIDNKVSLAYFLAALIERFYSK